MYGKNRERIEASLQIALADICASAGAFRSMCQRPIFTALAGRLARHPLRILSKTFQDPFRKLSAIDSDTSPAYGKWGR